jgi:hypothetical protein
MHRFTAAIILLGVLSVLVSQVPIPCKIEPIAPGGFGGYCATRIVVFHDGFPIVWYLQLGLILIWIMLRRQLDLESAKNNATEAS